MSLREFFPTYPLILKTPPRSRIKFGTRCVYVDLPWQVYYFLQMMMEKAVEHGLSREEVREEWSRFLEHYRDVLTFKGKPFVSVSLRPIKFGLKEGYLRLDVKWELFVKYLDEKARRLLSEVEEAGVNVMKVYREILMNFFGITGVLISPQPAYFSSSRENFRRLLRRTGDYEQIKGSLENLEGIIVQVENAIEKNVPSIRLYTTYLMMDVQHLRALIDVVNIPAAFLLLRNLLESFIKLFVYYDIGKDIGEPNLVLSTMFLYEYEIAERRLKKPRIYSLKKFRSELIKKLLKVVPSDSLLDIVGKLKESQVPVLGINLQVLEEFSKEYGLNADLDKLYQACSYVIHNQPPLPFFSLLEVKFFKYFLEKYLNSLRALAERLVGSKIKVKEVHATSFFEKNKLLRECLNAVRKLQRNHDLEVRDIIKKALIEVKELLVDPLMLAAIFLLIAPPYVKLSKKFSFTGGDLEDVIEKLQPTSFRMNLSYEVYNTLDRLVEILTPKLEKFKEFSSLRLETQKNTAVCYLLLLYLPEVLEEIVRGSRR